MGVGFEIEAISGDFGLNPRGVNFCRWKLINLDCPNLNGIFNLGTNNDQGLETWKVLSKQVFLLNREQVPYNHL
jgi:hypothetical protein